MRRQRRVAILGGEQNLDLVLAAVLAPEHDVVLLSVDDRTALVPLEIAGTELPSTQPQPTPVGWQPADLFRLPETKLALGGCDVAVYLGRPTLPETRLVQGSSADVERFCADTFARAAHAAGTGLAIDITATMSGQAAIANAAQRPELVALVAWAIEHPAHAGGSNADEARLSRIADAARGTSELGRIRERVEQALERSSVNGPRTSNRWSGPLAASDSSGAIAPRRAASLVRSVQTLPRPKDHDAAWIAEQYVCWLPQAAGAVGRVERTTGGGWRIRALMMSRPLLELEPICEECTADRHVFAVTSGLLSRTGELESARFEFRLAADGRLAFVALVDFAPRLPWPIYRATQALLHARTMAQFHRHLQALATSSQ